MALEVDVSAENGDTPKEYDYKSRCEELEAALNETRSALDDFQLSSRELEAELERELENMEKQYTDAKRQKERLRMESDEWKVPQPAPALFFFLVSFSNGGCRVNFSRRRRSLRRARMLCRRRSMRYVKRKEFFSNDYETSKCPMMTWNAMIGISKIIPLPQSSPILGPLNRADSEGWLNPRWRMYS